MPKLKITSHIKSILMKNNPLEKFIKTIKTGTRDEVKEAQKGVEKFWHNVYIPRRKEGRKAFSIFLDEIKDFDKIEDVDHRVYFISVLKWPFWVIGEECFEKWEEFVLKQIQHESGKIRQAIIHAADYLIMDIAMDFDEKPKTAEDRKKNEINKERFCNFTRKIELLLEKYDEPRFGRYKKISALPAGIFKSLQILIVEHVLRSEFHKKMYLEWINGNWKKPVGLNKNIPEELSIFVEYINYHKKIDWEDVRKNESRCISRGGKIFQKEYPIEEKKKLIFILAHIGTIDCHKALKKYLKNPDIELKKWAEIAFDECKNFLESDLREENQISATVGAVKEGNRLRFYFVLSHCEKKNFSEEEKKRIIQSSSLAVLVSNFVLEDIFIKDNYALITALHTADQASATLIDKCILACNQGETLVSEDYYVTNTHKPSEREIEDYIDNLQLS